MAQTIETFGAPMVQTVRGVAMAQGGILRQMLAYSLVIAASSRRTAILEFWL